MVNSDLNFVYVYCSLSRSFWLMYWKERISLVTLMLPVTEVWPRVGLGQSPLIPSLPPPSTLIF